MNSAWEHDTGCGAPCLNCGQGECPYMGIACQIKAHYCKSCLALFDTGEYWCVYIVECFDGTLYTGATNNLKKRIDKHNKGTGAKYTKTRRPVKLIRQFLCDNKSCALKLEYKIKQLSREEKLKFTLSKRMI
jgi:putative endonuclease